MQRKSTTLCPSTTQSWTTDYRRRLRLLRSEQPRAVVRISNTRTSCQLVTWAASDNVAVNVTATIWSRNFHARQHVKEIVLASYLVGYALGKAAIAAGHEDAVLIQDLLQAHQEVVFLSTSWNG